MPFRVRFVASSVTPVNLATEDAVTLDGLLRRRFDEEHLGLPDLLGRLADGANDGHEMTIDEDQAQEVLAALAEADGGLSGPLRRLETACRVYLAS